jgi:hypothetical protein
MPEPSRHDPRGGESAARVLRFSGVGAEGGQYDYFPHIHRLVPDLPRLNSAAFICRAKLSQLAPM